MVGPKDVRSGGRADALEGVAVPCRRESPGTCQRYNRGANLAN